MALSPQLLQFKSSGVYRLEFDKSQVATTSLETIRLIPGHSRRGPYNTPVYCEDTETFKLIFGGIDKKLEKKGMFFHRGCLEALKRGPILALNLAEFDNTLNVNNGASTAMFAKISTDGSDETSTSSVDTGLYADFHNDDKFMIPSDEEVLATLGTANNRALNLVNLGRNNLSIIVRQAQDVKAFEITARDWYGQDNIPDGIDEFDFISDYMVDIFVFKGKLDAAALDLDPVYGDYFTATGLIKDELAAFADERAITLEAQYTGCIIPNFTDLEGNGLYIEQQINAETRRTGLFCAVNEEGVEDGDVDLIGETYDEIESYDLLSYVTVGAATTSTSNAPVITYDSLAGGTLIDTSGETITTAADTIVFQSTGQVAADIKVILDDAATTLGAAIFLEIDSGVFAEVDTVTFDATAESTTIVLDAGGLTPSATFNAATLDYFKEVSTPQPATVTIAGQGGRSIDLSDFDQVTINGSQAVFQDTTTANAPFPAFALEVGDYLPALATGKLARVTRIAYDAINNEYTVTCHRPIDSAYTTAQPAGDALKSFEKAASEYKLFNLDKIFIEEQDIESCLTAFSSGGVYAALVDRDVIDFRYIIDTFGSFENSNLLNKYQLTQVAKDRQNVSCILNAPTVGEFKKSTNPSFKDAFEQKFDTRFIPDGGDLSQNPTATYALPTIAQGANYGFYYGPGLNCRENGKVKVVPPAACVSNNYIDKFTNALPWSIIAGPRRGIVSGTNIVGAEYAFDKKDRDNLEPFGINPIVFERGVGLNIKGNKTGQQVIKSALSSAHVREVLIFIENGLADILKGYLFEFNTAQTRLEIKTLADSFMEGILSDQGVYAYKNVMDQTNNTNEVIDNNMGILDTFVEPVKGLEIIVHRTTILNTGEIASGGY